MGEPSAAPVRNRRHDVVGAALERGGDAATRVGSVLGGLDVAPRKLAGGDHPRRPGEPHAVQVAALLCVDSDDRGVWLELRDELAQKRVGLHAGLPDAEF